MSKVHRVAPTPVAARHDLAATAAERREMGRQARVLAPRVDLGEWDERTRGHDPIDTLVAQNDIRLSELVPLRHQRMAALAMELLPGRRRRHGSRPRVPAAQPH